MLLKSDACESPILQRNAAVLGPLMGAMQVQRRVATLAAWNSEVELCRLHVVVEGPKILHNFKSNRALRACFLIIRRPCVVLFLGG